MTVKQLYDWCKAQRDKRAEVYLVRDWDKCDEDGWLTDLLPLRDVVIQNVVIDCGMDFEDRVEVLLDCGDVLKGGAE